MASKTRGQKTSIVQAT